MENNYPEFINQFMYYVLGIKNLSKGYIETTIHTIMQFLSFLNEMKYGNRYTDVNKMTLNDIRGVINSDIINFIYFLSENNYEEATISLKTKQLKLFFEYLYNIKHNIFKEPFRTIKTISNKYEKIPNYLSYEEAKKLENVYDNSLNKYAVRNKAIIHILLHCGLRRSEVINLKLSDFKMSNNTFTIIGKGNKERTGYLDNSTKNAILEYLEERKQIKTQKGYEQYLFISRALKKLNPCSLNKVINSAYELAGLNSNVYNVHSLRHTCATLLYRNGTNIRTIQELLGHSTIEVTKIYTHTYDAKVEKTMYEHPLAKYKMNDAMEYCVA